MRYTTLLIDLDDTLLDFQKCEYEAILNTFKKYNLTFNEEVFDIYKKHNHALWSAFERGEVTKEEILKQRFRLTFEELSYKEVPLTFEADYQLALGEGGFLMPYAKEAMEILSKYCDIYIATNGVSATQRSRLKLSGLQSYIKGIFISEELGAQKPQKEYFDAIFQTLGKVDKSSILMIGDSLGSDIQGGINAGIDTCFLNPSNKSLYDKEVTYVIKDLKQLVSLLLAKQDTSGEYWDLYDSKRNYLNTTIERGKELPKDTYHLVSEVWVVSNDKVLLTRRHPNKPYGGYFECTGGSVICGEDTLQGAVRELFEEIGLTISSEQLVLVGSYVGVNSIYDTYLVKVDVKVEDLTLLEEEVIEAVLVDYDTLESYMKAGKIVPTIVKRFEEHLSAWQKASGLFK